MFIKQQPVFEVGDVTFMLPNREERHIFKKIIIIKWLSEL